MYTLNFTLKFIMIKLNRHAKYMYMSRWGSLSPFFEFLDLVTPEPINPTSPKLRGALCVSVIGS